MTNRRLFNLFGLVLCGALSFVPVAYAGGPQGDDDDGSTPCSTGCTDMVAILAVFGAIGVLAGGGVNVC